MLEQQVKEAKRKNDLIESLLGIGQNQDAVAQGPPQELGGPFVQMDPTIASWMKTAPPKLPAGSPQAQSVSGGSTPYFNIIKGAMENDPNAISQMEGLGLAGLKPEVALGAMQKNRESAIRQQEVNQRNVKTKDFIDEKTGNTYEQLIYSYGEKAGQPVEGTQPWLKTQAPILQIPVKNADGSESVMLKKQTPYGMIDVSPTTGGARTGGMPQPGGGPPPAQGGGPGIQTAPAPRDLPIPDDAAKNYRGPNGEVMPAGMTPKQAQAAGYRQMTTEEMTALSSRKGALSVLGTLKDLTTKVFLANNAVERFTKTPETNWGIYTQSNEDMVAYEAFRQGTLAPLIRSFGEKGNLSDTDIARAQSLIPKLLPVPDTASVAQKKIEQLEKWLLDAVDKEAKVQQPGLGKNPPKSPAETKSSTYKSADDVRTAYKARKITREKAKTLLKDFGIE
jgi:hypothetical protein